MPFCGASIRPFNGSWSFQRRTWNRERGNADLVRWPGELHYRQQSGKEGRRLQGPLTPTNQLFGFLTEENRDLYRMVVVSASINGESVSVNG